MLIVFGPHFTSSSGAEERLNDAVGALKELLGEGCPWVGAVVRRLAQLHHIKGDAIMAEGLYGGAGGRFAALGEVDIPTTLRAEHVLQLVSGRPAVQIAPSPPQSTKQCMRNASVLPVSMSACGTLCFRWCRKGTLAWWLS